MHNMRTPRMRKRIARLARCMVLEMERKEMTPTETTSILRQFNERRRGDEDIPQFDPREIGEAIDAAVEMIERVVRLEPQPSPSTRDHNWYYAEGWNDCLREMTREESK